MPVGSFSDVLADYEWEAVKTAIRSCTVADVERALSHPRPGLREFQALISPAAAPFVGQMAALSAQRTRKRFGKTVQMYLPLYLHNQCQNICTYCGFSMNNTMQRTVLSDDEVLAEAAAIAPMGFQHILLVSGETTTLGVDYFARNLDLLSPHFAQLSLEVQPLDRDEYQRLSAEHGLHAVMVYQETYNETRYKEHHKAGKKRNYHYRVQTPDRLGQAGVHKIGIAALIGLDDWRTEAFYTRLHLEYLERRYWRSKYSLSFPRLRPFAGGRPEVDMSDAEFVQLVAAHRLVDGEVEMSLSTRERAPFRDVLFPLGFTSVSAGSATDPGGYANPKVNLEQFEISDERSAQDVAAVIRAQGLEVVWKDWDPALALARRA